MPEIPSSISREEYAAFIRQLELRNIWLHKAEVMNFKGPTTPRQAKLRFSSEVGWEPRPDGFRAFDHARVVLESTGECYAQINVTFGLDFVSPQPMTEEVFSVFSEVNLPVNTWPYLREFVSTTLGRMGWTPFTLPALKRGIRNVKANDRLSTPPSSRRKKRPRDEQIDGSDAP